MFKQLKAGIATLTLLALVGTIALAPAATPAFAAELEAVTEPVAIAAEEPELDGTTDAAPTAGAPAAPATTPDGVTPFEAMTVQIVRLPNTYFASATGFLNPEIQLPATVEIAVPTGSAIIWLGEPSGGDITSDPHFENPADYMRTEGEFDVYRVTLYNNPQLQIEFNLFFEPVVSLGDGTYALRMEYTPWQDLQALRLLTNLPPGSNMLTEDASLYSRNMEGENEYGFTFRDVTAGQMYTFTISYDAPRFMGTPNVSRVEHGLLITGAVVGVAVAGALIGVIYMGKRRRKAAEEDYDHHDEDYQAEE